jgi:hypothetical protein
LDTFTLFFEIGMKHILDVHGSDHILFVIALTAIYTMTDWKKVLILVTAFTIGHSITLALASYRVINVNSDLIEFLIPITIFLTALANIFRKKGASRSMKAQLNYYLALFFGLIHGLGFSNYLRSLLGRDEGIIGQLFGFNLGLEVGQIIIVVMFMFVSFIFVDLFGVSRRDWRLVVSAAVAGIAWTMMFEARFW